MEEDPVVARRRGVRGEAGTGEGARLFVVIEKFARRMRELLLLLLLLAEEEVEEVDDGEEGCADCGGVNVNVGSRSAMSGCAVMGVAACEKVVGVSG